MRYPPPLGVAMSKTFSFILRLLPHTHLKFEVSRFDRTRYEFGACHSMFIFKA